MHCNFLREGRLFVKFTIGRDVLTDAVTWTARSLSPRPPVPVLRGLLITAENNLVSIASFDYETYTKFIVQAHMLMDRRYLAECRMLNDLDTSFPNAPVTIELTESRVILTCQNSTFTLATMPVEEYPALPAMPEVAGTIDGSVFSEAISQVAAAASKDDTLPILTAVKIEIEGDTITFLATDRYRLAMKEITWTPHNPQISTSVLVKSRTLTEVARSLGGGGEIEFRLAADEDEAELVGFSSGGRRTTSLLVDGEYPKIRSLFPEESNIYATVDTGQLVEAVKRVALVAERNTSLMMMFSGNEVALSAGQGDDASATESVPVQLEGEDITVAFNPAYLSEGLNVIGGQYTRFAFTSAPKPALLTGKQELEGPQNEDYRYLVMPIRIPN